MIEMMTKFSYCVKCWMAQVFVVVNGEWVCENCGAPLVKAGKRG